MKFCRSGGYRPELAWTCYDYATALARAAKPSEREQAASLLEEGLSIATKLGMTPLAGKLTELQTEMDSAPARRPAYPDGLTQREVEVLHLISGGKTDREIGEELFISVNTVGNHVRNILSKTSAANRTEAASYANQHGLATPISDGGS